MVFKTPSAPKPQAPPPAPPPKPIPTETDPSVRQAQLEALRGNKTRKGRESTLMSGSLGDGGGSYTPSVKTKTLLGG
ncbi:hypothetical protein [Henriciella pelagia]|uniref:hypothetical protein n=1 Tax=Henriciella pelagia TaxID=1977912 RepID=UPI0035152C75